MLVFDQSSPVSLCMQVSTCSGYDLCHPG